MAARSPSTRCCISGGQRSVHKINFQHLRQAHFSSSLLHTEQLCPFPEPVYVRDSPIDVCRLRANFVDGGLLLVVSIIHTVRDGRAISDVIKIFAEKLREEQKRELPSRSTGHEETPKQVYSFNRASLLSGNGLLGAIENHPGWTVSPLAFPPDSATTETLCTAFHINSNSLRTLKQVASLLWPLSSTSAAIHVSHLPEDQRGHSLQQPITISTHDAIAALIWRSTILARHRAGILSDLITTSLIQPVDCRSRLQLPEPYFGNAVYGIKATLDIAQFLAGTDSFGTSQTSGLQAAARAIRAETSGVTTQQKSSEIY